MTIKDLLLKVKEYEKKGIEEVEKAYKFAEKLHDGQLRQSGEPYIIHPLTVAYILAEMHADIDTICAALLHDTIEDTPVTKEEIAYQFNETVATLVEGVTKISKMNFSSEEEMNYANTRKIITGITEDVRIIIIKLADRLHNMRTLEFKSEFKQKENALETLELYVPLAYAIGAYDLKKELEDLSLMYLYREEYNKIVRLMQGAEQAKNSSLTIMLEELNKILNKAGIECSIGICAKSAYEVYKSTQKGKSINNMPDLLSLKIIVNNDIDCYTVLGFLHQKYRPINSKFKDYICNPKTNMYQSLHTTVFGPEDQIIQTQIRTREMDKIASFGLTAYFDVKKGNARDEMQQDLRQKYQFFNSLLEINEAFKDNQDFVKQVKRELLSNKIYVYTPSGEVIELPEYSTALDFAYKISTELGNSFVYALVNGVKVPYNHILENKDRVKIVTNNLSHPKNEWATSVQTVQALKRIRANTVPKE